MRKRSGAQHPNKDGPEPSPEVLALIDRWRDGHASDDELDETVEMTSTSRR